MSKPDSTAIRTHEDRDMFLEAVNFTAAETGFSARLVEKDYFCTILLQYLASGKKRLKGGQERGVLEGEKAPEKGPPQLTDVWCLEMVPDAGVRRDVDGGTL